MMRREGAFDVVEGLADLLEWIELGGLGEWRGVVLWLR